MSFAVDAAAAAARVVNGDCDWPFVPPPLFFTFQTRLVRFSVTVPAAELTGEAVPPVLLETV